MTARKPATRKASKRKAPTLAQRMGGLEVTLQWTVEHQQGLRERLAALESRERLRDKSHDEPVSNASEAVGQFASGRWQIVEPSRWRRFLAFMGAA